jgi:hypothetical protein
MGTSLDRISQFLICRVDLSHRPVGASLDRRIAARHVRMMLARETAPGALDGLGGGVEWHAKNDERVSGHPTSLPGKAKLPCRRRGERVLLTSPAS